MKNCITIILLVISCFCYAQTYQTLNKIQVPVGREMTKKVTVKKCEEEIPDGKTIVIKKEYKDSSTKPETSYTVTENKIATTTGGNKTKIDIDKTIEIKLKSFDGVGNIYVDETDKSKVHINYWLNQSNTIKAKTNIEYIIRTYDCNGDPQDKKTKTQLNTDKVFLLYKYEKTSLGTEDFIKHSDTIIAVYKDDNVNIDYYLVNKYDRKVDYTIELNNREKISFINTAVEFGPITIPIKYRFSHGDGTKEVKEEFVADLNLGIFAGYRFGRYRARYERGLGFKELANLSCTVGGFLSASTATLSKANTNGGDNPITTDDTQSIGILSPGFGAMASMYGFNLGLFLGWDIGVGKESNNWNYDGKPWLGIGLAYSLTSFWKK